MAFDKTKKKTGCSLETCLAAATEINGCVGLHNHEGNFLLAKQLTRLFLTRYLLGDLPNSPTKSLIGPNGGLAGFTLISRIKFPTAEG